MTDPVNLDNLREMTGGEKEIEKELFEAYISGSDTCLEALREHLGDDSKEVWRTQAHAWKGMSLNLGAENLGQLCAQAQMGFETPADEKRALLAQIEQEYSKVKAYLASA